MPPRRKAAADGPGPSIAAPSPRRKRARPGPSSSRDELSEDAAPTVSTPSKRRRRSMAQSSPARGIPEAEEEEEGSNDDGKMDATPVTPVTPSRRGRGTRSATPRTPSGRTGKIGAMVVTTPSRRAVVTPRRRQAYDHSARKKSMRSLVERAARDDDHGSDDDSLAREICESEPESESCGGSEEEEEHTPSKKPTTARRKAAPARRRSPTPPRNLPAHERFFFDTKPGRPKTSDQTLAGAGAMDLLSHDEYFALARGLERHPRAHGLDRRWLEDLHAQSFPQWAFELREGFGVCLYGLGSKRGVVRRFAGFLSSSSSSSSSAAFGGRIVVVNGYVRSITAKDILSAIWTALFPAQKVPAAQPAALIGSITAHLCAGGGGHDPTATTTTTTTTTGSPLTLLINSIDAPPMRRPGLQTLVATLAATLRPRLRVLCTADTPDFALLWDAGRRTALNLVFHDCTTLAPLGGAEVDVVDEVHELLGRRARRAGGREGVAFVLRSLPEKARRMFGLLVGEVLVAMQEEADGGGQAGAGGVGGAQSGETVAVEWRMVYNKAVEEFICGSEMAFRTLLKEFYDHQMVISRTDALGTEMLSVPFRREELEGILEDICEEE